MERGGVKQRGQRPALWAAVAVMVGIAVHGVIAEPAMAILFAAIALGAGVVLWRVEMAGSGLILVALSLLGAASAELASNRFSSNEIGLFTSAEPRLARLKVRLTEPPRLLEATEKLGRPIDPRQAVHGDVVGILTNDGWQGASGKIVVHLNEVVEELREGQMVEAFGWLSRPRSAMNPGEFDWANYYRSQRLLATFAVQRRENVRIVFDGDVSLLSSLRHWTREALQKGFAAHSVDHALLAALVLGDNDPQLRDVSDLFLQTGTSHHLSISGLHVGVMAGTIFLLCHLLMLRPRVTAWIVLGFVALYGLVTVPSPPVIRSVLLCIVALFGVIGRRDVDRIQLLGLAVLMMLIYQPMDLYNPGFQLSFAAVLGLVLFTKPVFEMMWREDEDMRVAASFQTPPVWARIKRWIWKWFLTAVAAGIVAWAVSLPLILYHFDRLNPWAIVASIAMAPIVYVGLLGGFAKIVLTLALPWMSHWWALLVTGPMAAMRWGVEWLAKFPGSDVPLPAPSVGMIAMYYALLWLALKPVRFWKIRGWMAQVMPATASACCVVLPLVLGRAGAASELRVTVLYVGAGSCAVVETPGGKVYMVDAGSSTYPDVFRSVIEPFLRQRHIRHIDGVFVSHANQDHYGAVERAAANYHTGAVNVTPQFVFEARDNFGAAHMLRLLGDDGVAVKTLSATGVMQLDSQTKVECLWPPDDRHFVDNESSMVLKLSFAKRSILFSGDIETSGEKSLVLSDEIRSDVLLAPHHGSSEKTTEAFVSAVDPKFIISSNDQTLTHKQRVFESLIGGRRLYRTSRSGAVTVTVGEAGELSVSEFHGEMGRATRGGAGGAWN